MEEFTRGRTRTRSNPFYMRPFNEKPPKKKVFRLLSDVEEEDDEAVPQISVINGWEYEDFPPRRRKRRPCVIGAAIVLVGLIVFVYALIQDATENEWLEVGFNNPLRLLDKGLAIHLNPDDHCDRQAKSVTFDWTITTGIRAPDGVNKMVYLVNGEFPGPVVEARPGDRLTFNVLNKLEDSHGLSIHWHGLFMRNASDMDGALGLTQAAIPKDNTKTYSFTIDSDQCGTFWYHADSHLQRSDGLYGAIIIHCPEVRPPHQNFSRAHDTDQLLMISDWYHAPAEEILTRYNKYKTFGSDPAPASILVNSGGSFDCSKVKPDLPVVCNQMEAPTLMHLSKGATRLRLINTGSSAGFTIHANNAILTTLTLDGGNMIEKIRTTSVGVLYPGERVDVLIDPMDGAKGASLQIIMETGSLRSGNPATITKQRFPITVSQSPMITGGRRNLSRQIASGLDSFDLQSAVSIEKVNTTATARTILLYASTMLLPLLGTRPAGFINQSSWTPFHDPDTPALIYKSAEEWPNRLLIPKLQAGQWTDVVINNRDQEGHVFHLHGHSFYVLRVHKLPIGDGFYNPFDRNSIAVTGTANYDENPQLKDTIHVPAKGHVVIRFKPHQGLWALESSVLWDRANGMGMAFGVS